MAKKKVDIKRHLTPKEKIISEFSSGGYNFYATNKRIIKHRKKFGGEDLDDLMYRHISSLSIKSNRRIWLIISGILLMLVSFILNSLYFGLFGIILVVVGIFWIKNEGIFRASGTDPNDWKISDVKSDEAKDFIKTVRKYINIEME